MQQLPFVVIGDGVAARVLLFYLAQKYSDIPLVQISANGVFPACSMTTTSVNSLRGTTQGVSQLGDLIVDSYRAFEEFYLNYSPAGVHKTFEYQLWQGQSDKWSKRYPQVKAPVKQLPFLSSSLNSEYFAANNDAYVISHQVYLDWLMPSRVERLQQVVTDVRPGSDQVEIRTMNQNILAARCYICAGIFNQNFLHLVEDSRVRTSLSHAKPVAGTYAAIPEALVTNKGMDISRSFAMSLESINFIYRHDRREFLIGATTENNTLVYIPNENLFGPMYQRVREFLWDHLELPPLDKSHLFSGVRHKGQKRLPFWGKIADNTFMISALYKNAFTFANLAASDLLKENN